LIHHSVEWRKGGGEERREEDREGGERRAGKELCETITTVH